MGEGLIIGDFFETLLLIEQHLLQLLLEILDLDFLTLLVLRDDELGNLPEDVLGGLLLSVVDVLLLLQVELREKRRGFGKFLFYFSIFH